MPVIRTRRYNLLKIKELYHLKEKDKRLGRIKTESSNLEKLLKAESLQKQKFETYQNNRNKRGRQMHNQSYLSLMEKIKYDLRYWSMEKWYSYIQLVQANDYALISNILS